MPSPLRLLAAATALALAACAGYQLQGAKPAALRDIDSVAVRLIKNDTLHPRAESMATSAITEALVLDGTYRVTSDSKADAILQGTLREIDYDQIRGSRFDTLRPEELRNTVFIDWALLDATDPTRVLASGSARGSSQFFITSNLQTSRNNGLPDALERAAQNLVSTLANGF